MKDILIPNGLDSALLGKKKKSSMLKEEQILDIDPRASSTICFCLVDSVVREFAVESTLQAGHLL